MHKKPKTFPRLRPWVATLILTGTAARLMAGGADGSLAGVVVGPDTVSGVSGAQVVLYSGDEPVLEVASGPAGDFLFPVLPPGEYRLRAEKKGWLPYEGLLRIRPRQHRRLTVRLEGLTGPDEEVKVVARPPGLDPGQTSSGTLMTRSGIEKLPFQARRSTMALASNVAPGALQGHDDFVHLRGNELSLHEFINGVSFLDNPHAHFSVGQDPQIFDSVNLVTGGFAAEYGSRFGGVLDITTRSGRDMTGHGSASLGIGTILNHDASVDYGGSSGRWAYYFFGGAFQSGRFLNPPTEREIHDRGRGVRTAIQVDYQGDRNRFKLLLTGGGTNFELPNTVEEAEAGRDARRRLRSQTAILNWQHLLSPSQIVTTSFYQRIVSDRLLPTADPTTPFGAGSRSTLTVGAKSDVTWFVSGHTLQAGIDVAAFRLRESFDFDPREDPDDGEDLRIYRPVSRPAAPRRSSAGGVEAFSFADRDLGGQLSVYLQDHFSPLANLTVDAGLRWDQLNLVGSHYQVSPRVAVAYHLPRARSVFHFAYNRLFVPAPLEYPLLASRLGNGEAEEEREAGEETLFGSVQPYRQNYFELGWSHQLRPRLRLSVNAYHHEGSNAFENSEISNTRLFVPTNFHRARARGAEVTLGLAPAEQGSGFSGSLQYSLSRVHFFGPVSGGFPGEELDFHQRILPAFDQTHRGTAALFYHSRWRRLWGGLSLSYGSGTPVEEEFEVDGIEGERVVRLPQHLTANLSGGLTLWENEDGRVDLEVNVINVTDNIYRIAKESEVTPYQFAPRRSVQGRLTFHF